MASTATTAIALTPLYWNSPTIRSMPLLPLVLPLSIIFIIYPTLLFLFYYWKWIKSGRPWPKRLDPDDWATSISFTWGMGKNVIIMPIATIAIVGVNLGLGYNTPMQLGVIIPPTILVVIVQVVHGVYLWNEGRKKILPLDTKDEEELLSMKKAFHTNEIFRASEQTGKIHRRAAALLILYAYGVACYFTFLDISWNTQRTIAWSFLTAFIVGFIVFWKVAGAWKGPNTVLEWLIAYGFSAFFMFTITLSRPA